MIKAQMIHSFVLLAMNLHIMFKLKVIKLKQTLSFISYTNFL